MLCQASARLCRRRAFIAAQRRTNLLEIGTVSRYHSLAASTSSSIFSSPYLVQSLDDPKNVSTTSFPTFHFFQMRWKKRPNDPTKERKPTKKQRKAHNRKLKAQQQAQDKHGRPGSKAGPRREWIQAVQQDLLERDSQAEDDDLSLLEYDMDEALLDNLIGNTQQLSSQATPEPVYLGHKHATYYNRVLEQMDLYRSNSNNQLEQSQPQSQRDDDSDSSDLIDASPSLPSDRDISLVLRAFRDRKGTRQKPIGIVKALEHLLRDLKLPIAGGVFGEYTYTTLLTCCRTPAEGRRIFQMMKEQQHPISAYSWSILVDIYAKLGDYEGCAAAIQEMVENGGVPPTAAAYTSLLAGCYKVCNDGRVAHSIRAKAAKLAWEKWQEMRVVGVDPDVMAYGAMLRLCAALGHPERAVNILEEMQQMEVKPTTLCFSSALRAVAKSHAVAIRYERGASKKNKRREFITHHHGKLARSIVIMAENAEVEQDDGFVAALILCAAAAGDAATAKAIYVASQIRKLDQFRTIGPDSHLAQLRGDEVDPEGARQPSLQNGAIGQKVNDVALLEKSAAGNTQLAARRPRAKRYPSFQEREYGKDSRVLSAILRACAQAVDKNSIGTMWQGRENKGFLCENSLRLIKARWVPRYHDNSIPGQTRVDSLTWSGEHKDEDYRGGKRRKRKFEGVDVDENSGDTLDELDEKFYRFYVDEEGRRKEEFRKTTFEDIWRMKYGEELEEEETLQLPESQNDALTIEGGEVKAITAEETSEAEEEMYFDDDAMRWKTRPKRLEQVTPEVIDTTDFVSSKDAREEAEGKDQEEMFFDSDTMRWQTRSKENRETTSSLEKREAASRAKNDENMLVEEVVKEDLYFDSDAMKWKTRPKIDTEKAMLTDYESKILSAASATKSTRYSEDSEEEFAKFFADLKSEIAESGEEIEQVSEEEARELFHMMNDEYNEVMNMDIEELGEKGLVNLDALDIGDLRNLSLSDENEEAEGSGAAAIEEAKEDQLVSRQSKAEDSRAFVGDLKDEWRKEGAGLGEDDRARPSDILPPSFASNNTQEDDPVRALPLTQLVTAAETTTQQSVHVMDAPYVTKNEVRDGEAPSQMSVADGVFAKSIEVMDGTFTESVEVVDMGESDVSDSELEELRALLPAFSDKRLRKIKRAFQKSLGDPSLLDLIPIVRERMPDYITATWLKQMSALTARFVMHKASTDGLVDIHMINGVLELETLSGGLDRALDFYETEFDRHKLVPTEYSDRLVLQMFLKNNRLSRALAFKRKLNERGRTIDIPSYGSLIDYCSRHGQLGSSMLLLKECLSTHGAAPGEASLARLRVLCRKEGLDDALTAMVGKDPIEWLKHGEAKLKREMSKRGRRDVQLARNRRLQV